MKTLSIWLMNWKKNYMLKGVTEEENLIIKDILSIYNAQFYAYGSRVKGNFSELSDLDILVKSDNFDNITTELKNKFDQSRLPYVVNFTDFNSIDSNFYKLIEKDLTEL